MRWPDGSELRVEVRPCARIDDRERRSLWVTLKVPGESEPLQFAVPVMVPGVVVAANGRAGVESELDYQTLKRLLEAVKDVDFRRSDQKMSQKGLS